MSVLCDESGHTKFRVSYLAFVTMITLAQARLRISSGFAQAYSAKKPFPEGCAAASIITSVLPERAQNYILLAEGVTCTGLCVLLTLNPQRPLAAEAPFLCVLYRLYVRRPEG